MSESIVTERGLVVAPHAAAALAGAEILGAGGTAVDAMIAAAAMIAVVYPHMNHLGGDGFWLIAEPGRPPRAIRACGPAGSGATIARYHDAGHGRIPVRGPLAALTVPGAVDGWRLAHDFAATIGGGLPLGELLGAAIRQAKEGYRVSRSQARLTAEKLDELAGLPGFAGVFLVDGKAPVAGSVLRQERLADTLDHLVHEGLGRFYRGDVAAALAGDLARVGAPVTRADLEAYEAAMVTPLALRLRCGMLHNLPPPTQGLASLVILGLYDRLGVERAESFAHVHGLVEATKRAFILRDRHIADPAVMTRPATDFLASDFLTAEAARIDRRRAAPWPHRAEPGDTVWMGAIDAGGVAVSYIQSIYHEFGAGVVSPSTGVLMQNRGASFALEPPGPNLLAPGRLPFHTLNPALARLDDGRVVVYGTMGGDGQPQTQAAILSRAILHGGGDPWAAIAAPRWLLGRTWGSSTTALRLENRFDPDLTRALERAGHEIEVLDEAWSDTMGHAGMIVRRPDGRLAGAHDPRADGGGAIG